jgi:hypothetical protein
MFNISRVFYINRGFYQDHPWALTVFEISLMNWGCRFSVEKKHAGQAVYGEGSVFSVDIERNADVEAMQEAITDIVSTEQHAVPPRLAKTLTVYLAWKG